MSGAAAGEPRLSDTVEYTIGKAPVMMKPSGGKPGVLSNVGGASVLRRKQDRRCYCFEVIAGATEAAVAAVQ